MPQKKPDRRMPSRSSKAKKAARTATKTTGKEKKPNRAKEHAGGRPSAYTEALGLQICDLIATSTKSIRAICQELGTVSPATVYRWRTSVPEFREHYTRAKEAQAELMIDELLEIADDGRNDKTVTEDGKVMIDFDHIARSKLRVDARKWLAMKLLPKKYGDKVEHEHSGKVSMTLAEFEERVKDGLA